MIDWNLAENWSDRVGSVGTAMLELEQLCQSPIMLDQMYITGKISFNKFKDYCDILSQFVGVLYVNLFYIFC